jgi:hypothetical protein
MLKEGTLSVLLDLSGGVTMLPYLPQFLAACHSMDNGDVGWSSPRFPALSTQAEEMRCARHTLCPCISLMVCLLLQGVQLMVVPVVVIFFTYAECGLLCTVDNHVYVKRARLALLNRVRLIQGLHAIVLGK